MQILFYFILFLAVIDFLCTDAHKWNSAHLRSSVEIPWETAPSAVHTMSIRLNGHMFCSSFSGFNQKRVILTLGIIVSVQLW